MRSCHRTSTLGAGYGLCFCPGPGHRTAAPRIRLNIYGCKFDHLLAECGVPFHNFLWSGTLTQHVGHQLDRNTRSTEHSLKGTAGPAQSGGNEAALNQLVDGTKRQNSRQPTLVLE